MTSELRTGRAPGASSSNRSSVTGGDAFAPSLPWPRPAAPECAGARLLLLTAVIAEEPVLLVRLLALRLPADSSPAEHGARERGLRSLRVSASVCRARRRLPEPLLIADGKLPTSLPARAAGITDRRQSPDSLRPLSRGARCGVNRGKTFSRATIDRGLPSWTPAVKAGETLRSRCQCRAFHSNSRRRVP